MIIKSRIGLIGVLLISTLSANAQFSSERIARIDALIDKARVSAGIPGIGFALTQGASPLLVKGYGVRRAGSSSPVDTDTLFSIGSLTKAFTSTALAVQVDEGRLGWDDPIVRHLPWFRTSDPWVTAHATVRDVLAMRVGWPSSANSIVNDQPTLEGFPDRVAGLKIGAFRQDQGQDNNLSYVLAGQILETTAGKSWEEFIQARLLVPLQMRATVTQRHVANQPNLADAHVKPGKPIEVREVPALFQHLYPAGGLYSNALDMARWISFHLSGGRGPDGVIVSGTALRETHRPQILLGKSLQDIFQFPGWPLAFGLGWITYSHHNTHVLELAGAFSGFTSLLLFLPERDLGFVILTNLAMADAFPSLRQMRDGILTIIFE